MLVAEGQVGCDTCHEAIEGYGLTLTAFDGGDQTRSYEFDSWACLFGFLPSLKAESFVELPVLDYREETPGMTVTDFWSAIAQLLKV